MSDDADRVLVLNPASGGGGHAERVRELAADHDFAVRETEEEGDAADHAEAAAAAGADVVAAAGGDGTVNEVVYGIRRAGELDAVTLLVVPGGTGNGFAGNVGIQGIDHAFDMFQVGGRRRLDVGIARDPETETERPFVNSCVGGITAEASVATDADSKRRFGAVAYAVETVRTLTDFEGVQLSVDPVAGGEPWEGEAALVFVGNARGIPTGGRAQADVEDGLFEVAIVEDRPTVELVGDAAAERLFEGDPDSIHRMLAPGLEITVDDAVERPFSLDGETVEPARLVLGTRAGVLETVVGPTYEPDPDRGLEEGGTD